MVAIVKWYTCKECLGSGLIECERCEGTGANLDTDKMCRDCYGEGAFDCEECSREGGYFGEEDAEPD